MINIITIEILAYRIFLRTKQCKENSENFKKVFTKEENICIIRIMNLQNCNKYI